MTKRLITLISLLFLSTALSFAQSAQAVMDVKLTVLKAAEVQADLMDNITVVQEGEVQMGTIRIPSPEVNYQLSIPDVVVLKSLEGQTLELSLSRTEQGGVSEKVVVLNGKLSGVQLQKGGAYRAEVYTTIEYM